MKWILRLQPAVIVATDDGLGHPTVSPEVAVKIVDGDKLVFAGLCSPEPRTSMEDKQGATVAAVIPWSHEGYQFRGWVEVIDKGPLLEETADLLTRCAKGPRPMELPFEKAVREVVDARERAGQPFVRPDYVRLLHIQEIRNLTPGRETEVWR